MISALEIFVVMAFTIAVVKSVEFVFDLKERTTPLGKLEKLKQGIADLQRSNWQALIEFPQVAAVLGELEDAVDQAEYQYEEDAKRKSNARTLKALSDQIDVAKGLIDLEDDPKKKLHELDKVERLLRLALAQEVAVSHWDIAWFKKTKKEITEHMESKDYNGEKICLKEQW